MLTCTDGSFQGRIRAGHLIYFHNDNLSLVMIKKNTEIPVKNFVFVNNKEGNGCERRIPTLQKTCICDEL